MAFKKEEEEKKKFMTSENDFYELNDKILYTCVCTGSTVHNSQLYGLWYTSIFIL